MVTQSDDNAFLMCHLLDVANEYESIVYWGLMGIAGALLLFCTARILRLYSLKSVAKEVKYIHWLLFAWAFFLTADCVLNNVTYKLIVNQGTTPEPQYPEWLRETLPRLIFFSDAASAFVLHTVLIIIPLFWLQTIIYYIQHSADPQSVTTPTFVSKFLKVYLFITRIAYIGYAVCQFVISAEKYRDLTMAQIRLQLRIKLFMVIESVIIMIIMTYSCNILLTNFHDLAALTESEEESRMKLKTRFLVFCCFSRTVLDILPLTPVQIRGDYLTDQGTPCLQNPDFILYAGLLCLVYLLMHFLPVITILTIYTPKQQEESDALTKSMLSSSVIVEGRE